MYVANGALQLRDSSPEAQWMVPQPGLGPQNRLFIVPSHSTGGGLGGGAGRGHWKERQAHKGEMERRVAADPGIGKWWALTCPILIH